jgi:hypothetical protein
VALTPCFAQQAFYGPNSKLKFELQILDKQQAGSSIDSYEGVHLYYRIIHNKKVIIPFSPLGLILSDTDFFNELSLEPKGGSQVYNKTYAIKHGKNQRVKSSYSEQFFTITNSNDYQAELQVRIYKEGVAFRYILHETYSGQRTVLQERTGFRIDPLGKAWMMPYSGPTKWKPAYELYYENGSAVGQPSSQSPGWGFPALFHIDEGKYWVMLHEAGLTGNYPGTHLGNNSKQGVYNIAFPHPGEALGQFYTLPNFVGKWEMPWRVVMISDKISDLLTSNMVLDLNAPNQIKGDLSWIKPGRVSWEWWRKQTRERDFNLNKSYIDFAALMGWEYCLIDANWNEMKGGTINELITYAKSKNIGVFLWYNSGGPHNYVAEQPRGRLLNNRVREEEFERLKKWGVKGIKVDFFNTDKQFIIDQYLGILKDAAKYQLMVNFHGCTVPRGWSRTYPNLMTMEAAKGAETYGFDPKFTEKAPWHNVILAFTRNVIGPMDYTPVAFSNHKYPRKTTLAHELALSIVYQSGLLHFPDEPEAYLKQPKTVVDFLKIVPAQFDELKFLKGTPDTYIALARRKGKNWYVGIISGQDKTLNLSLDLSFLNSNTLYEVSTIKDDIAARSFHVEKRTISKNNKLLTLDIATFGGAVLHFTTN